MHVDVNKTGRHHVPARVERFIRSARKVRADLANHAVFNADVQCPVEIVFRRQNAAALDQYGSHEVLNDIGNSAGREYSTGERAGEWGHEAPLGHSELAGDTKGNSGSRQSFTGW